MKTTAGLRALLLAAVIAGSPGCLTDDQRSFSLSRSFYAQEDTYARFGEALAYDTGGADYPGPMLILLALPFAVDVVLLPITLPLDVYDWTR